MNWQPTNRQLEILQHALGVDKYGQGEMYRNHFCAGGEDEPDCRELVAKGYMETWQCSFVPYYNCSVTPLGIEAMRQHSPAPPKLTRSQKRYREYLKADTGERFGVWLKDQKRLTYKRLIGKVQA